MDEFALEVVAQLLAVRPSNHYDLTLRGVLRILDVLETLLEMPRLS